MTIVSVPGQGTHSDGAKMKVAVSKRGLPAPAWEPVHKCGRLGAEITGANPLCSSLPVMCMSVWPPSVCPALCALGRG